MMRLLFQCVLSGVLLAATAGLTYAQSPTTPPPTPPRFDAQIEVVGVTPIHGAGLPRHKVPANVQVFSVEQLRVAVRDVPSLLAARAASIHVNEAQAGTFQPDLQFRGFAGSPLLGASEGLAVYQDGVRVNDPFGDTVNWDALPSMAVSSINLLPGSNPLFGLNALGGALSLQTKNGFDFAGHRASVTGGSYGRGTVEAETGGHRGSLGYYAAGTFTRESGWRDFSRSTVRRLFADVTWRGRASTLDVSLTAASNDLTGNGGAPPDLLDQDWSAVFTHPDLTAHDLALVTVRARRTIAPQWTFEAVGYTRTATIDTFNGDAAEEDEDEGRFDAINNRSRSDGLSGGATAQVTHTGPLAGRVNHFVAGGGLDAARTRFAFTSELATLTPDRGTIGSGIFDEDENVGLRSRAVTASMFVTDTWSVSEAVALTGSARLNRSRVRLRDQLGTALDGDHAFFRLNPSAGATVDVGGQVNLFGGYSESSRVPTPVELTCADPEDPCRLPNAFVSDPPLDQVVARTWEIGVRRSGRANWSVALFTTRADEDIIFVSSGTLRGEGHFTNVPRTQRAGIEAGIDAGWGPVAGFATYTFQRASYGSDLVVASPNHPLAVDTEIRVEEGDRMPGVPSHHAKLGVTAAPASRFSVTATARLQAGQYLRGDEANLLPTLDGFAIVGVTARHEWTPRLTIVGQVDNLFNTRYTTFGALGDPTLLGEEFDEPLFVSPGAPRGGWIGFELRF